MSTVTAKYQDLFWATCGGQFVHVMLDVQTKDGQMILSGWLVDMDDDYYYIGESPLLPTSLIKRNIVNGFQLVEEDKDEATMILEEFEPTDDEIN